MSETKMRPDLSRPFKWKDYRAGETPVCTRDGRVVGTIFAMPDVTDERDRFVVVLDGEPRAYYQSGTASRVTNPGMDLFFAEQPRVFTDEEVWEFAKSSRPVKLHASNAEDFANLYGLTSHIIRYALAEIERAKRGAE